MKKIEEKVNQILEATPVKYVSVRDINTDRVSTIAIYDYKPGVFTIVGVLQHNTEITFSKKDAVLMIKELKKIK